MTALIGPPAQTGILATGEHHCVALRDDGSVLSGRRGSYGSYGNLDNHTTGSNTGAL